VGALGEEAIARWLMTHGWAIVARRWRCRWGELDLVVAPGTALGPDGARATIAPPSIVFVEVKTRGAGNWDADGALAISPSKQAKLWQAVRAFLAKYPQYGEAVCRFDVALVRCDRHADDPPDRSEAEIAALPWPPRFDGRSPLAIGGYRLQIARYIEGAIEADG